MGFDLREKLGFTIVDFNVDLYQSHFSKLKPHLASLFDTPKPKIVFNLMKVRILDSTTLGMIMLWAKKVTAGGGKFIFINIRKEVFSVLSETKIGEFVTVYKDEGQFERETETDSDRLKGFGQPGPNGYTVYDLKCDVCGYHSFKGQAITGTKFENKWNPEDVLPEYYNRANGQLINYYENLISVCPECFYASNDIYNFSIISKDGILKSQLPSDSQLILRKTAARREAIITEVYQDGKADFKLPRNDETCYVTYKLLLESLLALSFDLEKVKKYDLAKFFFITAYFSDEKLEHDLLEKCLEWALYIIQDQEMYKTRQVMECYYYHFSVLIKKGQKQDARKVVTNLKINGKGLCRTKEDKAYFDFWSGRMEYMWNIVIKDATTGF